MPLKELLKHYEMLLDFQYICKQKASAKAEITEKYSEEFGPALTMSQKHNFGEVGLKYLFTDEERFLYELDGKGIKYPTFRILECISRQVMMSNGNFEYENDGINKELFKKGLSPEGRLQLIERHISKSKFKGAYGLGILHLDKFDLIKRTEKEFSQKIDELEEVINVCLSKSSKIKGVSSDFDLLNELKKSEESLVEWVQREIQVGEFPLREFISIDRQSKKISFQKSKFIYFSLYTLAAKGVFEPLFQSREKNDKK